MEAVGQARLLYAAEPPAFLREHINYCLSLFRQALELRPRPLKLVFGDLPAPAPEWRRVDFQWEHTLVRPGGRDSEGALPGPVPTGWGDERYLVRLEDRARLERAHVVIDYSRQNLAHIAASGQFPDLCRRMIAISPLLHPMQLETSGRTGLISTFADPRQPRRAALLQQAAQSGVPLRNIRGIWDGAGVRSLYRSHRVLLNVHQTDHHHTLEELRVLPALLSGMIVVSESVPLRETLPHRELILWADYARLLEVARAALDDYPATHARIFGGERAGMIVRELESANRAAVEQALQLLAA